jgi:hypothetical protein
MVVTPTVNLGTGLAGLTLVVTREEEEEEGVV